MSTIEDKNLALQVARTIRGRREQLGLTLRALASKSGVSASMISDIERGAKSPTISTLSALARTLGLPVSAFVDRPASGFGRIHVVRASEPREFIDALSGAKRRDIGAALAGSNVEFVRYAVPPHTVAGPFTAHERGTIEHMHLASGRVRIEYGTEVVTLEAGDSCTCIADAPHRFDNREGDEEALIYLVIERP